MWQNVQIDFNFFPCNLSYREMIKYYIQYNTVCHCILDKNYKDIDLFKYFKSQTGPRKSKLEQNDSKIQSTRSSDPPIVHCAQ